MDSKLTKRMPATYQGTQVKGDFPKLDSEIDVFVVKLVEVAEEAGDS
jgi:hypothetical protein